MADIKPILTNEEFEAIEDKDEKALYKKRAEDYILDVASLKNVVQHERAEAAKAKKEADGLAPFKGLDLDEVKEALEAKRKAAEKKIVDKEGMDALLRQKEEAAQAAIRAANEQWEQKHNALLGSLKIESFKNFLTSTEAGILPDRVEFAVGKFAEHVDFVTEESGFRIKAKHGIGDPNELKNIVGSMRESYPWMFAASVASGSGASGSQSNNGGNAKTITVDQYNSDFARYGELVGKGEIQVVD